MTSEAVQAGVGTAHLSPELTDDDKYTIHGVALGAGDVTVGSSGIKKKWPATELSEAVSTLEGQPLVRDHENNTDGTVGTVTKAHYRDGVGVVYEAELASHYEQLAQDIKSGLLEVSARAYHAPVEELEEDDDTGALVVEDIRFDNLSIVSQGASPSNSVKMGEATALAQGPDGGAVAVMEAGGPRLDAAELREEFGAETETEDNEPVDRPDPTDYDPAELADIDGMQIFGLVMWGDDNMGVISDFMEEDGDLMLEITVLEREDGSFSKTGETVTKPLHEVEKMEAGDDGDVAELEAAWHTPDWSGLAPDREWSEPDMEDFDTDDMSAIDDHFFVSKTGEWPPDDFGDLALPCVFPNGDLSLDGLDSVHEMAKQTDGVSEDMAESIKSKANSLAKEHFDQPVAGEEMEDEVDESEADAEEAEEQGDDDPEQEQTETTFEIATLQGDDPETASTDEVAALEISSDD